MKFYKNEEAVYDTSNTAATTGGNRVPSLTQLCEFFDYSLTDNSNIIFNLDKMLDSQKKEKFNYDEPIFINEIYNIMNDYSKSKVFELINEALKLSVLKRFSLSACIYLNPI